jgi:hypothetical protein
MEVIFMSIKCNHLVPNGEQYEKCNVGEPNSKTHYWIPTGNIEAKFNNTIKIDFICKYCDKRTTSFLNKEEYELNKRIIGA